MPLKMCKPGSPDPESAPCAIVTTGGSEARAGVTSRKATDRFVSNVRANKVIDRVIIAHSSSLPSARLPAVRSDPKLSCELISPPDRSATGEGFLHFQIPTGGNMLVVQTPYIYFT